MCLGLCHTVVTDDKEKNGEKYKVYNASSPDELALVNGMRHLGFAFRDNDSDANMIIDHPRTGAESKYTLLHVIEFNSDRKRMSVIVRDENNRVLIICKGADSIIEKRLAPNQEHLTATKKHVDEYAEVGLRTLLIAYKYVEEDDYKKWLEELAPFDPSPERYHHNRTGEDNADAHHKRQIMGREVVVAITKGRLDFGPWEQVFYGEFDGRRAKRVLVKIIGE